MGEEQFMTKMASSFLDELISIQKEAGVVNFLGQGLHGIGRALGVGARGAPMAGNMAQRVFGRAAGNRSFGQHISHLYNKGAQGAGGSMWQGVKNVATSPVGQMAAAGAVPLAAGYAIS